MARDVKFWITLLVTCEVVAGAPTGWRMLIGRRKFSTVLSPKVAAPVDTENA